MATILDVVSAVRTIVFAASGIASAYANVPTKPPTGLKLPAALCRIDPERRGVVDLGSEEFWFHPIRIDVLVDDASNIENSFATVEPFILAVVAALRGHASIGGIGALQSDVQYGFGPAALWDVTYWAASLFITVQEHISAVTLIAP